MDWEALVPAATLLAGWFLRELSDLIGESKKGRRSINMAIADLLDAYYKIGAYGITLRGLREGLGLKNADLKSARGILVPDDSFTELANRYEATVSAIAEHDPVLALKLRSKLSYLTKFYKLSKLYDPESPDDHQAFREVELKLVNGARSQLGASVRFLSKELPFWKRRHVVSLLNEDESELRLDDDIQVAKPALDIASGPVSDSGTRVAPSDSAV